MKKLQLSIIFILFLSVNIHIAEGGESSKPQFYIRKKFTYLIAWNSIPIGSIYTESRNIINYKDWNVYVVKITTESNKFLSKIYRVEDIYTSYIDTQTMTSRRYEADRKEGRYRKHVIVEYDFDKNEAIYTSLTDGSVKTCPIDKNVQDPVSAMCYVLMLPLVVDQKLTMTVNLNEKNYRLYGKVEEAEPIRLSNLGIFPVFKIQPYAKLEGKEIRRGKAWMYFSQDEQRYPLYGVVLTPFGKVTATLKKAEDI